MPRKTAREPGSFRLCGTRFHITYRTHLDEDAKKTFRELCKHQIKQWSFVHELGKHDGEEGEPYEHTHIYVRLDKKLETENQRYFDINGIHPHIKAVLSRQQERQVLAYHQKAPIHLEQDPPFITGDQLIESAAEKDALDWINEQLEMGGNMGQISGMLKYQELAKKRKREMENPLHTYTEFTRPLVENFKCLYVWGPTNLGKTQWCKMHFKNYLLVRHMDDLKKFDDHDGIVFDDMSFKHLPREANIHITDWEDDASIHCRNTCGFIPRHTRKIFTSNHPFEEIFHDDEAVRRRFDEFIHITEKTY